MTRIKQVAGKGLAMLGAAGFAVIGLAGVASADVGPDQPDHPKTGSLTIHKYDADQGEKSDGNIVTDVKGDPLGNVDFTIWRLGMPGANGCTPIDLTDTKAWTDKIPTGTAPATLDEVKAAGFCVVDPAAGTTVTTNDSGEAKFDSLAIGLYYVDETDSSEATNAGEPVSVVSEAAPFYVTVPLPNKGDWIYDVHAYPKNQTLDAPVKTINSDADQGGLKVGDTVKYTITQTVPSLNAGETYNTASIWDVLPTGELAYDATTSVKLAGTTLAEGTDYTIDANGITWTFTTEGLKKLEAGQTIEVVFTAKVVKVPDTGAIENPGNSEPGKPGYGSEFNGSKIPGETTPYTYWGQLKVTKVDQDSKPLAGAEFEVYPSADGKTCAADVPATGLVSKGISDAKGLVQWDFTDPASSPLGLFVANSENGALTDPSKVYCMYETKVPAGYTGVTVQTLTIKPGTELVVDVNDLTIKNVQKNGPHLPLTGANGTMLMAVGGLALVSIAGGLYLVTRRKTAFQE